MPTGPMTVYTRGDVIAPIAGLTPEEQVAESWPIAWWTPNDLASMTVERDGSGGAPGDTDPVGTYTSQTVSAWQASVSLDANRPTLNLESGKYHLTFDGSEDRLGVTGVSFPTSVSIFSIWRTTDTSAIVYTSDEGGGFFAGYFVSGGGSSGTSSGVGTPTTHVDNGAAVAGRGPFYTAVADGSWHVVEVRAANLKTNFTEFWMAGHTGTFSYAGDMGPVIIVPTSQRLTLYRAGIIQYLQDSV